MSTSTQRGHSVTYKEDRWVYTDDNTFMDDSRPCIRCNNLPTKEGYDFCLKKLPGVKFACCGHGVEEGYIIFENGVRIEGHFKVTNNK